MIKEVICFSTKEVLKEKKFESFLPEVFGMRRFEWLSDFYSYMCENELDFLKIYTPLEYTKDRFKKHPEKCPL